MDDSDPIPGRDSNGTFFLRHRVQTGSEAHAASYPMSTVGSYPGGKEFGE